jgi:hypothetical protein
VEFLRKIILAKISSGLKSFAFELDEKMEKAILDLAQKFGNNELIELINLFTAKKFEIKSAAILQLPLELAVIEYCTKEGKEGQKGKDGKDGFGPSGGVPQSESGAKKVSSFAKASEDKVSERNEGGVRSTTLKNTKGDISKNLKVNLSEIREKWHNFLVKLQEFNASLVFILKVAEPLALNGNILKIGFKYPFHQQRINQLKVKAVAEKVLAEFFKEEIIIETCLLSQDYDSEFIREQTKADEVEFVEEIPAEGSGQEQQQLIDNLVKTFGGKVVE